VVQSKRVLFLAVMAASTHAGALQIMKKVAIAIAVLVALFLGVLFIWLGPDTEGPKYIPGEVRVPANYDYLGYEFMTPNPFHGGKMWVSIRVRTNHYHVFLYDLEQQKVLGELKHANPVFMNREQTRVLCSTREPAPAGLLTKFAQLLYKITFRRIGLASPAPGQGQTERFWLVELRSGSASPFGSLPQFAGAGSSFVPSPDFRFGYNKPSGYVQQPSFAVCDLDHTTFKVVALDGQPQGWWDNQHMVVKTPDHSFMLFDAVTGTTNGLLSAAQVQSFLEESGVREVKNSSISLFRVWTGSSNQFYLTDAHQRWLAKESFLAKLSSPGPGLEMVAPEFKFEWSDHLDSSGSYYVFSGRESGQASAAVFVREVRTGDTRTLVPDNGEKRFSLPNFYGTDIIYVRSNRLWRVDVNGSGHTQLFPPVESRNRD